MAFDPFADPTMQPTAVPGTPVPPTPAPSATPGATPGPNGTGLSPNNVLANVANRHSPFGGMYFTGDNQFGHSILPQGGNFQDINWQQLFQNWRSDLADYRQNGGQRPTFFSEFQQQQPVTQGNGASGGINPGGPVATPGGGGTGAPLQGGTQVGMVPGVPGSMGLNPGSQQDWRSFAPLPSSMRFGRTGG